ncbi:glycine-rich RNA-binding, abscisic acid-inducible protein-like [Ananas comosus]|uniref:Glycine-rich RNA-binding, abscisic acid-inducible protein-like n=1 Tax=Ananas comosus TaxID=4615 RepID=A0A6P5EHB4_ANACO|nr:glycine-rich RNA-binding, abscisic acid-inducible protein-like [Ananas comosus]
MEPRAASAGYGRGRGGAAELGSKRCGGWRGGHERCRADSEVRAPGLVAAGLMAGAGGGGVGARWERGGTRVRARARGCWGGGGGTAWRSAYSAPEPKKIGAHSGGVHGVHEAEVASWTT